jgi:DNA repair protein RecN (Recombination protein N)
MGEEMQVLVITHLPQIASKGNDHLKVIKFTHGKETSSQLIRLHEKERIDEIASMLSGKELSEAALSNARSLLGLSS